MRQAQPGYADVFLREAAFELFNLITSESAKLWGVERNWKLCQELYWKFLLRYWKNDA